MLNPLNYCTFPYATKLVEKGIVLKTEKFYRVWTAIDGTLCHELVDYARKRNDLPQTMYVPAPSMAEVWRKLPRGTYLLHGADTSICWTNKKSYRDTNPTDALIDLLTKQKRKEKKP